MARCDRPLELSITCKLRTYNESQFNLSEPGHLDPGLARVMVILGALIVSPIYVVNTINDAADCCLPVEQISFYR
jgi:hypothetical protein